jgi:Ca2+-binding EF-hand superfamily protein
MGSGASSRKTPDDKQEKYTDVNTPRGVSAKAEVVRLRGKNEYKDTALVNLSKAKFQELDANNSGYLEGEELGLLIDWVVQIEQTSPAKKEDMRARVMARADMNRDDKLDYREFEELFKQEMQRGELIREAKDKFEELDVDKNGTLENSEINLLMDWCLSSSDMSSENKDDFSKKITERYTQRDGALDFDEFVILFEEEKRVMATLKFAQFKFRELDDDNSGYLDRSELDEVVEWMLDNGKDHRRRNSSRLIKNMMKAEMMNRIDSNGDGKLSLEEFIILCESEILSIELKKRGTIKFYEMDKNKSGYLEGDEILQGKCICSNFLIC